MEFQQIPCRFLRAVVRDTASQEETLEVRLPESMPDVGKPLCVWGQPMIRSKQWQDRAVGVSGGVMTWVLYAPEDGTGPRCLEAWIPFQRSWEFSESRADGSLRILCTVASMDARTLSARKLMVRAGLSFFAEALEPATEQLYRPGEVPEDVELLEESYPVTLAKEGGEKSFVLEQQLNLPSGLGGEKLLYCRIHPELTDQKVVGDKLVFRGAAVGQGLLRDGEGQLRGWDFEIPFSHYAQLDREYGPEAVADVLPAVTNLETELLDDDTVRVKAGLVGQYLVYERSTVTVLQDAYSPCREVKGEATELSLPALLDRDRETLTARVSRKQEGEEPVDLSFALGQPELSREGDRCRLELNGGFQLLSRDPQGALRGQVFRWEGDREAAADPEVKVFTTAFVSGRPKHTGGELCCDVELCRCFTLETRIPMITALELGPLQAPDPRRPSLILCRGQGESLWELAKSSGSTVKAIRDANGLSGEPEPDRLLVIPIP